VLTAPLSGNREIRFCLRGSLGGGVASTRSEGECGKLTDESRNAEAKPSRKLDRQPQPAARAGRKRQPITAASFSAVEDERRAMASTNKLVAKGVRSSKELDKKPI
jgi:hypothetical protein